MAPQQERVTALFSYVARSHREVPMMAGDTLQLIKSDNSDWWKVEDARGRRGFVPASYVKRQDNKLVDYSVEQKPIYTQPIRVETPATRPPLSPMLASSVISDADEQTELTVLNTRLAKYIQRVRAVEAENRALLQEDKEVRQRADTLVDQIKIDYERELQNARFGRDNEGAEKAQLQQQLNDKGVELDQIIAENGRLSKKLDSTDAERHFAINKQREAEHRADEIERDRDTAIEDAAVLKQHSDQVQRQLEDALAKARDEAAKRAELERQMRMSNEEHDTQTRIMQTRVQMAEEVKLNAPPPRVEIQADFAKDLQTMRDDFDREREEQRDAFDEYVKSTRQLLEDKEGEVNWLRENVRDQEERNRKAQDQCDDQQKLIKQLQDQLTQAQKDNADLQNRFDSEREAYARRAAEMGKIRMELSEQLAKYRELLDIKMKRDTEVAFYRKLLDLEDNRQGVHSTGQQTPPMSASPASLDGRAQNKAAMSPGYTPMSGVEKRGLVNRLLNSGKSNSLDRMKRDDLSKFNFSSSAYSSGSRERLERLETNAKTTTYSDQRSTPTRETSYHSTTVVQHNNEPYKSALGEQKSKPRGVLLGLRRATTPPK